VVKSIIKTLIQEYPIYSDASSEYYEVNDTIEKYGKNLKSALKTLAKGNTVSKAKLMETMKSIGMDVQANIF
jgi:hypothetical protein